MDGSFTGSSVRRFAMLQFWIFVAIATLLVTAALVLPLFRHRPPDEAQAVDEDQRRLDVFRDRRREIERERASGRLDAREADQAQQDLLRQLATDLPRARAPAPQHARTGTRGLPGIAALALVVLVPALAFTTYREVGTPTLVESRPTAEVAGARLPPGHPPTMAVPPGRQQLDILVAGIEQRTREAPEDGEAWAMLGAALKMHGRHQEAVLAFEQAIGRVDPDARLLAEAAESIALARGGDLSGRPVEMLERALALDAAEPRALWLMAAAQFRAGNLPRARHHLEQLRDGMPPASTDAAEVGRILARIDAGLQAGGPAMGAPAAPPAGPVPGVAGATAPKAAATIVAGTVVVDPRLAKQAERGGTLFLIARQASGPPIPVAVRREPGASLPMSFALGDANAMTPSRPLSTAGTLTLEARLSRSGVANRQAGDLYGLLAAVEPGRTDLRIVIDQVVTTGEEAGNGR